MNSIHGKKMYSQVLIDPHRGELLNQMREAMGMKTSGFIRQVLYEWMESKLPASVYNEAKAKDEAVWAESVSNRVKGRQKARAKAASESAVAVAAPKVSAFDWMQFFRKNLDHQS